MWIKIEKNIFETKDTRGLYFLLNVLTWNPANSIPRYHVYVDSRDLSVVDSYISLSFDDKKLLDDEFDAYYTTTVTKIDYLVSEKNDNLKAFNLEEAIRFFLQPLSIILENNKNDAAFIKAIIYHFDTILNNDKQTLVEFIGNGWIQFENAGGCTNVENFIEGKLQSFNELAVKNRAENHKYIRCIVILDSDKEFPTQAMKPEYIKLLAFLKSKNITNYHILEKRMMENYMPDEVINSLNNKTTKPWIDVYNTLNANQKDFLNYKGGFSKEKDDKGARKPLKNEIISLYNLSASNFNQLDSGLKFADFKDNFPNLFLTSGHVSKFSLKKRAASNELEEIIEKIKILI